MLLFSDVLEAFDSLCLSFVILMSEWSVLNSENVLLC